MADDRVIYAGDLSTDHIGKVVRFSPKPGVVIEDTVTSVAYGQLAEPRREADPKAELPRSVYIEVLNLAPKTRVDYAVFQSGWTVSERDQVTVISR